MRRAPAGLEAQGATDALSPAGRISSLPQKGRRALPGVPRPAPTCAYRPEHERRCPPRPRGGERVDLPPREREARAAFSRARGGGPDPFLCECGDARCTRTIKLSLDEYEAVRERADHFAIVSGTRSSRQSVWSRKTTGTTSSRRSKSAGGWPKRATHVEPLPFPAAAPHTHARADRREGGKERGALPRGQ